MPAIPTARLLTAKQVQLQRRGASSVCLVVNQSSYTLKETHLNHPCQQGIPSAIPDMLDSIPASIARALPDNYNCASPHSIISATPRQSNVHHVCLITNIDSADEPCLPNLLFKKHFCP